MRNFIGSSLVVSLLAVAAVGVAYPGVAVAAPRDAGQDRAVAPLSDSCATGQVEAREDVYIRERPYLGPGVGKKLAKKGAVLQCREDFQTSGDQYKACGAVNSNAWIYVRAADGEWGYSVMPCWDDV